MDKVILCVDDEEIVLSSLEMELGIGLQGYVVEVANSAEEALEIMEELDHDGHQIQAVICDYIMPKMRGDELLSIIHQRYPNTINILLTGQATAEGVGNAVNNAGLFRYITKPWDNTDLILTIQSALKCFEQERQLEAQNEQLKLANASLEKQVEARTADLVMLEQIGRDLTSTLDLEQVIKQVYHRINTVLDANVLILAVLDHQDKMLRSVLFLEEQQVMPSLQFSMEEQSNPGVWCIENRHELVMNELADWSRYFDRPLCSDSIGSGMNTVVYQPLIISDKVIGCISLQSPDVNAYSSKQLDMIRSLSSYIAIAMDNALGYEQLKKTHDSLKSTQAQLVLHEKMAALGTMTAGVAHEINNPNNFAYVGVQNMDSDLKRFKTYIYQLLCEDTEATLYDDFNQWFNTLFAHISTIKEGADRIKAIVSDLQAYTHISHAVKEAVDIGDCIHEAVELVKRQNQPMAQINLDISPTPQLNCFPNRLCQVLMNVLDNACDAIKHRQPNQSQGEISIKCCLIKINGYEHIQIQVIDSGCGMDESIVKHVFEPFYTTKDVGEGTGLGMAISFAIVKEHEGTIEIESSVKQGTVVTILLPII